LDGATRPVTGVMSLVSAAQAAGIRTVIVAAGDEAEAVWVAAIVVVLLLAVGLGVGVVSDSFDRAIPVNVGIATVV
jgi:hypothetical protein